MWYNRLSEYLEREGYKNNLISPCIFTKKFGQGFVIIAVYVDDLNILGTSGEISQTIEYLKKEFEMKDLGKQSSVWDYSLSTLMMESLCIKWHIHKSTQEI